VFNFTFLRVAFLLITSTLLCSTEILFAQKASKKQTTRILFLLDASGSMYAKLGSDTRINVAKRLLSKSIDSLANEKNVELALRVYGHTSPPGARNCKDTRLEVPFRSENHKDIIKKIQNITPKGTTLIAHSLLQAASDFPQNENSRNVIILITDGIEECQGDPCAVSEALQSKGIILKPFIIGLGSTEDFKKAFDCVGRYYDANSEEAFNTVLNVVISQALNNTTAQINLLDIHNKPSETNVNMSFYDMHSGMLLNNYMHTINERGNPDTVLLDPIYRYKMVVHTLPPVIKENIELIPGKHTIIAADAPQGELTIRVDGLTNYNNLQAIVKQAGSCPILHIQDASNREKYLVGKYDVEVLCLPKMLFKGVSIDQSTTTTIQLPQPGKLVVNYQVQDFYADIYQQIRGELMWVCKIPSDKRVHQFVIQPGDYKIIYRSKSSYKSANTFERGFKITSGQATNIILN
jgi:Ca-activated chloride channel family protein